MSLHVEGEADLELVWLDASRLTGLGAPQLIPWLIDRLRALRSATPNPILCLVFPLGAEGVSQVDSCHIPGLCIADLDALMREFGADWLDKRTATISGTELSSRAALRIARELACRWIPACILPPMKAVALDLDETLFNGVLGEDGPTALVLSLAHKRLQEQLLQLRENGVYLALATRNEQADVEALFAARPDFPLRLGDFSSIQASWGSKAAAVSRIAEDLRIAPDAVIFVDDNAGELEEVAEALPVVTIHARTDADETWAALSHVA
ncbi:MAG: HAD-IIIC family phosphatase, partial [Pseudomonadota bacterium]|nr:HAD-IIIC family phosphatase [Pseudomonadota bacterium]